jgi:hypothetical protein
VKVGEKECEWFKTTKGVRQGYPINPLLFTIYVPNMDDMLKKSQPGGNVVGREKVWSLALADDLVIVPKSEGNDEEPEKVCEEGKAGSEC